MGKRLKENKDIAIIFLVYSIVIAWILFMNM
jgi:hypothetical protein